MTAEALTSEQVRKLAADLRTYATHFAPRDWDYTRNHGNLTAIRYDYPTDRLRYRIREALAWLIRRDRLGGDFKTNRWLMARTALRREAHLPDGVLDGGNIITHWEETGEYLQYVQPTVGALIAEWLDTEPENPHAQKVATEMCRIQDAYTERLRTHRDQP